MIGLLDVDGLTAADLATRASTLPVASTVGALRAYFAESSSRRLAVIVDGDRYVGSITPEDLAGDLDAATPAADLARRDPVVESSRSAAEARDAVLDARSAR